MDKLASLAQGNGFDLLPGSPEWVQTRANLIAQSADPALAVKLVQEVIDRWPGLDALSVAETLRDVERVTMEKQAICKAGASYLALPPVLAALGNDAWYLAGLPWGRASYRKDMYVLSSSGEWVYEPMVWELAEVLNQVEQDIRPTSRRLAVSLPLAYRVGFSVGWLSGLAVSQPDEARKGLVILAGLVAPLLVAPGASGEVPPGNRAARRAAARAKSLPAPRGSGKQERKG